MAPPNTPRQALIDGLLSLPKARQQSVERYHSWREARKDELAGLEKQYDETVREFEAIDEEMVRTIEGTIGKRQVKDWKHFKDSFGPPPRMSGPGGNVPSVGEVVDFIQKYRALKAKAERYQELRGIEDDLAKQIDDLKSAIEKTKREHEKFLQVFDQAEEELRKQLEGP